MTAITVSYVLKITAMTVLAVVIVPIVCITMIMISCIRALLIFLNFIFKTAIVNLFCRPPPLHNIRIIEDLQIDGEYVLHDVMDIVCKYADAESLYNISQVCRSWCVAAIQERKKRSHFIRRLNGTLLSLSHLPSSLKAIPFASLFFYVKKLNNRLRTPRPDITLRDLDRILREHKILTKYRELLPNMALAFKVDMYFTMEHAILQRKKQGGLEGDRKMMGLFFPSTDPRVSFHVASIMEGMYREIVDEAVDRLTEELGFNDSNFKHSKSTILMFSIFSANENLRSIIDQLIKRQAKKRREITFAGFYGSKVRVTDDNRPCVCCGELRILFRISGPRVESWSTFIGFFAKPEEIHSKLCELKKRVKSKRHCFGLVYAPRCSIAGCNHYDHPCAKSIELMKTITRVFPYIRFTGLFQNCMDRNQDRNPLRSMFEEYKDLNDEWAENQGSSMHVSIIIISHD